MRDDQLVESSWFSALGPPFRKAFRHLFEQRAADMLAHGLDPHAVDHFAGKGMDEQVARVLLADPARAQVEERLFLELADRRAVIAFDVVVMDLERRLRVDDRGLREDEVAILLTGDG